MKGAADCVCRLLNAVHCTPCSGQQRIRVLLHPWVACLHGIVCHIVVPVDRLIAVWFHCRIAAWHLRHMWHLWELRELRPRRQQPIEVVGILSTPAWREVRAINLREVFLIITVGKIYELRHCARSLRYLLPYREARLWLDRRAGHGWKVRVLDSTTKTLTLLVRW